MPLFCFSYTVLRDVSIPVLFSIADILIQCIKMIRWTPKDYTIDTKTTHIRHKTTHRQMTQISHKYDIQMKHG